MISIGDAASWAWDARTVSAGPPDPSRILVLVCGRNAELEDDPAFRLVRAGSPDEVRARLDEAAFDCAVHDLGKVVVPDAILHKPGPLTPAERREIERHAEIGCRLLAGSNVEFLDLASVIAHTHHERYDGTGYPRRLAGEDIPLAGRVAAL